MNVLLTDSIFGENLFDEPSFEESAGGFVCRGIDQFQRLE